MLQAQAISERGEYKLKMQDDILFALGANLESSVGAPEDTVKAALQEMVKKGALIRNLSPLYSTPAFPAGNGPDYVNAAVRIRAPWSPDQALAICHEIEALMGRERVTRWGQRTLDIDLIAMGQIVLPDAQTHAEWRNLPLDAQQQRTPDQLILPHPRLQDRAFVLVPLADVAPDWVHPLLGCCVSQMRDALDPLDLAAVKALE
jgi:2-amino-4-hydroxy-6-hydroxymethyldihydropteridine diphosphokinase